MTKPPPPADLALARELRSLLAADDLDGVRAALSAAEAGVVAAAVAHLAEADQAALLTRLAPREAARVCRTIGVPPTHRILSLAAPATAAGILAATPSDFRLAVLEGSPAAAVERILAEMPPEVAAPTREVWAYPRDRAGGMMIKEYLAYREDQTIGDVIADLQANRERYADLTVQYMYIVDGAGRLTGVIRVRDLLFPPRGTVLAEIMIRDPKSVGVNATLDDLRRFFMDHPLLAVPVVAEDGRLVGLERRASVEAAVRRGSESRFLRLSGIVGGEEFRTMPLRVRAGRRLSWLSLNIVLNLIAASVIAVYQDTLAAVIALAVFLPMISDMSGCSGNQAVAVSMRELALGLVRPTELLRVIAKEVRVGVVNGLALGLILGAVALVWKGNAWLGLVVGAALAANTVVAVCLGGALPLLLKRLRLDPALVSGPLLTTVTDMCGFFFVLSVASLLLERLPPT